MARRSSVLNQKLLNSLEGERPVMMRKKTKWVDDTSDDNDDIDEKSNEDDNEESSESEIDAQSE